MLCFVRFRLLFPKDFNQAPGTHFCIRSTVRYIFRLQTGLLFLTIVLNASCPNPNPMWEHRNSVHMSHKGLGLGHEAFKIGKCNELYSECKHASGTLTSADHEYTATPKPTMLQCATQLECFYVQQSYDR